jgi:hypothetical protein
MTRGEIREHFFGDKDASKRRELQYIPGDAAFLNFQQLLMTIDTQKQQMEQQNKQLQMQQEQHQTQMDANSSAHAHVAVAQGQQTLQDTSKKFGRNEQAFVAGQPVKNPINQE